MSLGTIRAFFRCDGCVAPMQVDLDPAQVIDEWVTTPMEIAEGALKDNVFYTMHHGQHYCRKCSVAIDKISCEDPTEEAIKEALDKAHNV